MRDSMSNSNGEEEFYLSCGCDDCANQEINNIVSESMVEAAKLKSEEDLVDLFLNIAKKSQMVGIMRHEYELGYDEESIVNIEEESHLIAEELVEQMEYFKNSSNLSDKNMVQDDIRTIVETMLSFESPEELDELEGDGYIRELHIDEDEKGLEFKMRMFKEG